jgi:hypothetical protein
MLAQGDQIAPWEGVRGAFQHTLPRPEGQVSGVYAAFVFIGTLLAVIALLFLAMRIFQRERAAQSRRLPHRFMAYALGQMGVGWMDRFWLLRAARHSALTQPAMMLLSPELFEKYAGGYCKGLHPACRGYVRGRLAAVSAIAFPGGASHDA